jgi:lactobin A/cerein 7B family class IIb bacteriocin
MNQINTNDVAAIRELSTEELEFVSGGFVMQTYAIALAGGAAAFPMGLMAGAAIHTLYSGAGRT